MVFSMEKAEDFKLDFIGIGVPKAATTWLAQCMKEHPEICFPKYMKELHFFNRLHCVYGDKVDNMNYENKGWAWFKYMFKHCKPGQIKGEFTVAYYTDPLALKRIKQHNKDIKLILVFRDPVSRAYSEYQHHFKMGIYGQKTFEQALEVDKYLIEKGLYFKHTPQWLRAFPKKNIKIYFMEDIKQDKTAVIKDLWKFLGVNEDFVPPSFDRKDINIRKESRFLPLNRFLSKINYVLRKNNWNTLLRFAHVLRADFVLNKLRFKNVKPADFPPINPKTAAKLRKYYTSDIKKFEKFMKRDLSGWYNKT